MRPNRRSPQNKKRDNTNNNTPTTDNNNDNGKLLSTPSTATHRHNLQLFEVTPSTTASSSSTSTLVEAASPASRNRRRVNRNAFSPNLEDVRQQQLRSTPRTRRNIRNKPEIASFPVDNEQQNEGERRNSSERTEEQQQHHSDGWEQYEQENTNTNSNSSKNESPSYREPLEFPFRSRIPTPDSLLFNVCCAAGVGDSSSSEVTPRAVYQPTTRQLVRELVEAEEDARSLVRMANYARRQKRERAKREAEAEVAIYAESLEKELALLREKVSEKFENKIKKCFGRFFRNLENGVRFLTLAQC